MNPRNQNPQEQHETRHPHRHRRGRLGFFGLAALVGIATLVAVTVYAPAAAAWGQRSGWGHGPHHGEISDTQVLEHVRTGADKLIRRVEGNEGQRAALDPIIDRAVPELLTLRVEGKTLRSDFHAAVMRPDELDRAELEGLRKQGLELADRATSRILDALVEVSRVLTPEQRADLQEDLRRMDKWR